MQDFNQIYKQNHKMVLNFIFSKIKDAEVSQELANDVFMRVHDNLEKYNETISSFKTWLMNIANHAVIDHWRKVKMNTISIDQTMEEETQPAWMFTAITNSTNPEKRMIDAEALSNFRNIIDALPTTYVKIANLFFNEQFSYEEIAKALNIPLGTVKGQLFRVRELLEKQNVIVK